MIPPPFFFCIQTTSSRSRWVALGGSEKERKKFFIFHYTPYIVALSINGLRVIYIDLSLCMAAIGKTDDMLGLIKGSNWPCSDCTCCGTTKQTRRTKRTGGVSESENSKIHRQAQKYGFLGLSHHHSIERHSGVWRDRNMALRRCMARTVLLWTHSWRPENSQRQSVTVLLEEKRPDRDVTKGVVHQQTWRRGWHAQFRNERSRTNSIND